MKKMALLLFLQGSLLAVECDSCPEEICCEPCCERWGFFLDAEFLYWYAKENHLPIVTESVTIESNLIGFGSFGFYNVPKENEYMDSRWDPGFRVGLGWTAPPCSSWETGLYWTYTKNDRKRKLRLPTFTSLNGIPDVGQRAFVSSWVYPIINGDQGNDALFDTLFNRVDADWSLRYNVFDLKFSRSWCFNSCFFLEPFFGVRGGWTKIHYDLDQSGPGGFFNINGLRYIVNFTNEFWGVGIFAGLSPTWFFSDCFGLFGEFGGALLWGKDEEKRREKTAQTIGVVPVETEYMADSSQYGMQGIIDVGVGLRYQTSYCCERFILRCDLGWEHHYWVNHVHRMQVDDPGTFSDPFASNLLTFFRKADEVSTDLGLGGLVVKVRFDF